MSIKELKARRDELWSQLDDILAKYKPQEVAIRKEIKTIQEELYKLEMTPVMLTLRNKVSEGDATPEQVEKLAILEAKLG